MRAEPVGARERGDPGEDGLAGPVLRSASTTEVRIFGDAPMLPRFCSISSSVGCSTRTRRGRCVRRLLADAEPAMAVLPAPVGSTERVAMRGGVARAAATAAADGRGGSRAASYRAQKGASLPGTPAGRRPVTAGRRVGPLRGWRDVPMAAAHRAA